MRSWQVLSKGLFSNKGDNGGISKGRASLFWLYCQVARCFVLDLQPHFGFRTCFHKVAAITIYGNLQTPEHPASSDKTTITLCYGVSFASYSVTFECLSTSSDVMNILQGSVAVTHRCCRLLAPSSVYCFESLYTSKAWCSSRRNGFILWRIVISQQSLFPRPCGRWSSWNRVMEYPSQ